MLCCVLLECECFVFCVLCVFCVYSVYFVYFLACVFFNDRTEQDRKEGPWKRKPDQNRPKEI